MILESDLQVVTVRPDEPAVLVARGEIDIATAPQLTRAIDAAVDAGTSSVAVDMAGVTFIDSTGVSLLASAARRCEWRGGGLELRTPSPAVVRVAELTGLDHALGMRDRSPTGGAVR